MFNLGGNDGRYRFPIKVLNEIGPKHKDFFVAIYYPQAGLACRADGNFARIQSNA